MTQPITFSILLMNKKEYRSFQLSKTVRLIKYAYIYANIKPIIQTWINDTV